MYTVLDDKEVKNTGLKKLNILFQVEVNTAEPHSFKIVKLLFYLSNFILTTYLLLLR